MLEIYKTVDDTLTEIPTFEEGIWLNMVNPTPEEITLVEEKLAVNPDFIRVALDDDERAHTEREDDQTLIIVDTPFWDTERKMYSTMPLAIIITPQAFLTVCLREATVLNDFTKTKVKHFYTQYKARFVLQILYRNATKFFQSLRTIDKLSNQVERELHVSMRNKELIDMLALEKSLVFFSTALRSNEMLLEKLLKYKYITNYQDDRDLLEDVIIENKQAMEMCNIYSSILSGTMDAFASVISNNLNIVMKILTSITLVMAIPNIVFGLFGMNVVLPFTESPYGLLIILAGTVVLCCLVAYILKRKDLF